ncbi:1-acyl-sn-glycerol-3-phosphate acyltransferase [Croceicoccus mobilis]|uniref:1-acyl-sn-glycerol-3-phosphate acyltransferase n=1 Tax=Croceicoccus mobilis TaxID=1703339 RepID=A0A916YPV3_9SPHN|nr:1-acyl-sn-glycerol-3-phosphate acyltransferase [Croceicoccus mobilis]
MVSWRAGLRLVAMAIWLVGCVTAYYLVAILPGRNPVPPVFLAGIAFIAGVEIEVRGTPPRRAMLLANHVSWMDIPVLAATARSAFVAHDGLQGHPILKRLCEMNRTVFIARSRRHTVADQVAQLREALEVNHVLTLFPEGTTGTGDCLLPVKSSLLSAIDPPPEDHDGPVPIVPVLLAYEDAPDVAWGDQPGPENFIAILSRREPVRVTVHFLPPLAGEELAGRKAMAAAITAHLSDGLNAAGLSKTPALA